jgi:hypothetical protein
MAAAPTAPEQPPADEFLAPPPAPGQPRAIASDASVRLTWWHGAGDAQVTGHVVTGPDDQTREVGPEPVTRVTGLVNGQACSFTVAAVNEAGPGPASSPSVPVTPQAPTFPERWTATTPMPTARTRPSAVRLQDGRVLVVGGTGAGFDPPQLSTCELFHPDTATWTSAAPVGAVASHFELTLLPDGRVLRTGGFTSAFAPLSTAESLDPATGQWTPVAPMAAARYGHTAVLLTDGRVLVAGGTTATTSGPAALAATELYDPATDQWSTTGPLTTARTSHSAIRLPDGRVLAVGGTAGAAGFSSAELYDPPAGTWSGTGSMSVPRSDDNVCCPGVALLPGGDVLVAGGSGPGGVLSSAEVYRVATGTWEPTGDLVVGRDAGFVVLPLPDGRILVAGGRDDWGVLPYAELYDEPAGTWTRTSDLLLARLSPAAALLLDGRVLVVGGAVLGHPGVTAAAETFGPA